MTKTSVKKNDSSEEENLKKEIAKYRKYHRELDEIEKKIKDLRVRLQSVLDKQNVKNTLEKIISHKD
ncbi:MAG TPA: hypothetical protein DEB09_05885 [Candidatus Magasanikbacteria bacterium]|nr:hypothetical protein [Candidatus Magasanikbacteria bacterium]